MIAVKRRQSPAVQVDTDSRPVTMSCAAESRLAAGEAGPALSPRTVFSLRRLRIGQSWGQYPCQPGVSYTTLFCASSVFLEMNALSLEI